MKGDFSRDTFDPLKHFTRVLMQQGRVQLDSDWNEQTSLLWHFMRTFAADLIGPYGGPAGACGFAVNFSPSAAVGGEPSDNPEGQEPAALRLPGNFTIGRGRYYVGGLLCENEQVVLYATGGGEAGREQPDLLVPPLASGRDYLVYLDAWEQHVTAFEDESIREVALGSQGPDTTTRARVVWVVRALDLEDGDAFERAAAFRDATCNSIDRPPANLWGAFLERLQPANRGMLRAKAEEPEDPDSFEPCIVSPDARFRGAENQLYRVEIHVGGVAGPPETGATFKWSRENGSVVLPVRNVSRTRDGSRTVVTLEHMGRDARSGVEVGDWVEIFDADSARFDRVTPLLRVVSVDPVELTVTLSGEPHAETEKDEQATPPMKNPLLRRWDQKEGDVRRGGTKLRDGAAVIREDSGEENWIELEDGVRIQFRPGGLYRAGDYWLIPARTETGDVEWPGERGKPEPRPPHGVEHVYAPLARIQVLADGGRVRVDEDFRRTFPPLALCRPA
jgi:hypothetical protein